MEAILARIQKLFELAGSSNEHESRAAAAKANELLVKHNLTTQSLERKEYEYKDIQTNKQYRFEYDEMKMLQIIQQHFFCRVVLGKDRQPVYLRFAGKKENVEIGIYVYHFLISALRRSFNEKVKDRILARADKKSYVLGFYTGLTEQLSVARKAAETAMALTVLPDRGVHDFIESMADEKSHISQQSAQEPRSVSDRAANHGLNDGRSTRIHRAVKGDATASGKYLGGGSE